MLLQGLNSIILTSAAVFQLIHVAVESTRSSTVSSKLHTASHTNVDAQFLPAFELGKFDRPFDPPEVPLLSAPCPNILSFSFVHLALSDCTAFDVHSPRVVRVPQAGRAAFATSPHPHALSQLRLTSNVIAQLCIEKLRARVKFGSEMLFDPLIHSL